MGLPEDFQFADFLYRLNLIDQERKWVIDRLAEDRKKEEFKAHIRMKYHNDVDFHARVNIVAEMIRKDYPQITDVLHDKFIRMLIGAGLAVKDLDLITGELK